MGQLAVCCKLLPIKTRKAAFTFFSQLRRHRRPLHRLQLAQLGRDPLLLHDEAVQRPRGQEEHQEENPSSKDGTNILHILKCIKQNDTLIILDV